MSQLTPCNLRVALKRADADSCVLFDLRYLLINFDNVHSDRDEVIIEGVPFLVNTAQFYTGQAHSLVQEPEIINPSQTIDAPCPPANCPPNSPSNGGNCGNNPSGCSSCNYNPNHCNGNGGNTNSNNNNNNGGSNNTTSLVNGPVNANPQLGNPTVTGGAGNNPAGGGIGNGCDGVPPVTVTPGTIPPAGVPPAIPVTPVTPLPSEIPVQPPVISPVPPVTPPTPPTPPEVGTLPTLPQVPETPEIPPIPETPPVDPPIIPPVTPPATPPEVTELEDQLENAVPTEPVDIDRVKEAIGNPFDPTHDPIPDDLPPVEPPVIDNPILDLVPEDLLDGLLGREPGQLPIDPNDPTRLPPVDVKPDNGQFPPSVTVTAVPVEGFPVAITVPANEDNPFKDVDQAAELARLRAEDATNGQVSLSRVPKPSEVVTDPQGSIPPPDPNDPEPVVLNPEDLPQPTLPDNPLDPPNSMNANTSNPASLIQKWNALATAFKNFFKLN